MPPPKIYAATELASLESPTRALKGTRKAAQSYVDRVTATDWWRTHALGYWDVTDPPPDRVWVWQGGPYQGGETNPKYATYLRDQELPMITVGHGCVNGCTPALADKWVLLHELTHVSLNQVGGDGHHGPQFCATYTKMVDRFLGPVASRNLIDWSRRLKIRMDYSLFMS